MATEGEGAKIKLKIHFRPTQVMFYKSLLRYVLDRSGDSWRRNPTEPGYLLGPETIYANQNRSQLPKNYLKPDLSPFINNYKGVSVDRSTATETQTLK